MSRWGWFLWSLLGGFGVIMAALIAHVYPPETKYFMTTANKMHFVHLMPLLVILLHLEKNPNNKLLLISLILFLLGYVLFPFAIYVKYTFNIMSASKLAPYGGYSFSIAWLLLAISFIVKSKKTK